MGQIENSKSTLAGFAVNKQTPGNTISAIGAIGGNKTRSFHLKTHVDSEEWGKQQQKQKVHRLYFLWSCHPH